MDRNADGSEGWLFLANQLKVVRKVENWSCEVPLVGDRSRFPFYKHTVFVNAPEELLDTSTSQAEGDGNSAWLIKAFEIIGCQHGALVVHNTKRGRHGIIHGAPAAGLVTLDRN